MSTPAASIAVTQASMVEAMKTAQMVALSSVHYSLLYMWESSELEGDIIKVLVGP